MATPRDRQEEYSTLEVNATYLETQPQPPPEVNRTATAHLDIPEAAYKDTDGGSTTGYLASSIGGEKTIAASPTVCGISRKAFFASIIIAVVTIIALGVGLGVGLTRGTGASDDTNSSTKVQNSNVGLYSNTKIAAANFTDEFGHDNVVLVYQLQNRAIYMSAYNSSKAKWIVSPVVDGTNGIKLDQVREGTSLGLHIYYKNETHRYTSLHWQTPNNGLKKLFRSTISTNTKSSPKDWDFPFEYDLFTDAMGGTSLSAYGRQCFNCIDSGYFFFQAQNQTIQAEYLRGSGDKHWERIDFSRAEGPSNGTSIAIASVAAVNGTRGLSVFYRAESGVLTQIIHHGRHRFSSSPLSRGLGARSAIAAFAVGFNETNSDNPDPLVMQVLTTDPDSDDDSVYLMYFKDDEWTTGGNVTDLASCSSHATMTATYDRRVYCVVNGENSRNLHINEWVWRGNPRGDTSGFTRYENIGTVDTKIQ